MHLLFRIMKLGLSGQGLAHLSDHVEILYNMNVIQILFDCSYSICLLTSFSCGIWYVSSVEIDSFGESDSLKETGSKKR